MKAPEAKAPYVTRSDTSLRMSRLDTVCISFLLLGQERESLFGVMRAILLTILLMREATYSVSAQRSRDRVIANVV